jgi:hypothetical protein
MPRYFLIICVLSVCLFGDPWTIALAQERSDTYERERMSRVLQEGGFEIHPEPEGRTIAFIRIDPQDVFVEEEPWPTWLNVFHWRTDRDVIARELLFHAGEPYKENDIQETMRNLRNLGIFSLVSIRAVKIPKSEKIGVIVHTRDIWSLRLSQDIQTTGTHLDRFYLQLTENNLFGRQKNANIRFSLFPFTYRIGEAYIDRRVLNAELMLQESFDLIFNRSSGNVEGSAGALVLGRPFYNLSQRWSYDIQGDYYVQTVRIEKNGKIKTYIDENSETTDRSKLPLQVYDDKWVSLRATGRYRIGNAYKQTFSAGAGFRDRAVAPNRETNLAPDEKAAFARDVMPKPRRDLFPFIGYELNLPTYVVLQNLATFGQSETVRVGPRVEMIFELPLRAYGSSSDSFVPIGEIGYVWSKWDALVETSLSGSARLENGRVVDQVLHHQYRGATPPLWIGRFVMRFAWDARRADTSNTPVTLGGDNGLRGYRSKEIQFPGANDRILGNLEFRTLPLRWKSVQAGSVLFYDVGSVYKKLEEIDLYHAIGIGLRLLFPQFNRYVFRFDFGIPLNRSPNSTRAWSCCQVMFTFGGEQAVPLTAAEDAFVSTGE